MPKTFRLLFWLLSKCVKVFGWHFFPFKSKTKFVIASFYSFMLVRSHVVMKLWKSNVKVLHTKCFCQYNDSLFLFPNLSAARTTFFSFISYLLHFWFENCFLCEKRKLNYCPSVWSRHVSFCTNVGQYLGFFKSK